jgi:hypothetical protein
MNVTNDKQAPATEAKPARPRDPRSGNRTAAALATVLTIAGHALLGFEQALAHVFVALATGYTCALLLEYVDARANARPAAFAGGGWPKVADFLVSVHMTSITMSFLIYTNTRLAILAFAVALAVGSKYVFRVRAENGRYVHFFNPSNFGIAVTLFLFPWVSIIPYMFLNWTENWTDFIVPCLILMLGTRLNLLFTKRLPLIGTWLLAFVAQAFIRSIFFGTPFMAGLTPMTGVAFVLFSFYMITDPMTSPKSLRGQIVFGIALAAAYGVLLVEHVIFTLFYAVFIVTAGRGVYLYVEGLVRARQSTPAAVAAASAT